jgi:hypothetical protein
MNLLQVQQGRTDGFVRREGSPSDFQLLCDVIKEAPLRADDATAKPTETIEADGATGQAAEATKKAAGDAAKHVAEATRESAEKAVKEVQDGAVSGRRTAILLSDRKEWLQGIRVCR